MIKRTLCDIFVFLFDTLSINYLRLISRWFLNLEVFFENIQHKYKEKKKITIQFLQNLYNLFDI